MGQVHERRFAGSPEMLRFECYIGSLVLAALTLLLVGLGVYLPPLIQMIQAVISSLV
jgi:hypothetical protein